MVLAKCSFPSNWTIWGSIENRGTGDSPTCCFCKQLIRVSFLGPSVLYYPLLIHILWQEHQLVDYLHWWYRQSAPSC